MSQTQDIWLSTGRLGAMSLLNDYKEDSDDTIDLTLAKTQPSPSTQLIVQM